MIKEAAVLHGSLRIERIQIIECRKNAIMNDNTRALFQSRNQVLEYLNGVFVCPVMEDVPEVIDISRKGLWIEEVATVLSIFLITG